MNLDENTNTYSSTRMEPNSLACDESMTVGFVNPYERLFLDVDARLRIPQDDLRFDTEVGRGKEKRYICSL